MSNDDNKFEQYEANLDRKGLDGTSPVHNSFNLETERGQKIAKASPRAKELIADLGTVRESLMRGQLDKETKYKSLGLQKERARLIEKQFSSAQPIPNDPQARELMQKEIEQSAIRNCDNRNQFFRDQIDKQYEQSVQEVLKMDREGRLPDRSHDQSHQQDHEHGRER
mgnify:CR=1 FL=1